MENINIKIHNYEQSKKQSKEIGNKIEVLLKQIPCDSRVFLDFDYKNKIFYGKLRVDCHGKSFLAKDQDALLVSLTNSLCKKIQKQAMKWKTTRTVEEITGIISMEMQEPVGFSSFKKAG